MKLRNQKKHYLFDKWKYLTKKLAYPYEYFHCLDDYQKLVDNLKKEYFFSKLKNGYPDDDEIERTKEIIKNSILKMEKN